MLSVPNWIDFGVNDLETSRQPDRHEVVTHVSGTFCYPCVRAGQPRFGGRGGIRAHGTLAGTPVFKTGALNHSATLPIQEFRRLSDLRRGAQSEQSGF